MLKKSWNLTSPFFGRGVNFLVLPFTLLIYKEENFIKITYSAMLVIGVSLVASLGISPRILKLAVTRSVRLKNAIKLITLKLILFWSTFILLISSLPINLYLKFTGLDKYLLILTIIEGVILGINQDILTSALQGKRDYTFINTLSFLGVIILGPVRIVLAYVFEISFVTWIELGIATRIVIICITFIRNMSKNNSTSLNEINPENSLQNISRLFGVWNFVILIPSFVWIIGNLDRLLIPTSLDASEGARYQLAFQCASLLGLLCGQLIILDTHGILSSNFITVQNTISKLITIFRLLLFVSLPCVIVLFRIFYQSVSNQDVIVIILLLCSQFIWALAQICLLYVTTIKNMTLIPVLCCIAGVVLQLSMVWIIGSSMMAFDLPILPILGFSIIALGLTVLDPTIRSVILNSVDIKVYVDILLISIGVIFINKNNGAQILPIFLFFSFLASIHIFLNSKRLLQIWKKHEFSG